ncbi:unnamed protein product [Ilex paraguariensis]|uniref:Fe2OG dioxygenase domain-containing protein n=1 Tax=Ilex paraguariensis TaxID=185542 RepID=A0ABC8TUX5_9AQUA
MGMYSSEVRKVSIEIFEVIMESLNSGATYLRENFNQGFHILGINSYPPCSKSDIKMGTPPHSDHSIITVLLQSCPGLEVVDRTDGEWKIVPDVKGSLAGTMDEVVEPAVKLLDEEHPKAYKESSLSEFLKHLSIRQTRTFIETLRI